MFEIGNSLREARVRQGLDYPQVELATKIRTKYLRAIEDEQFGVLPAEPYVKGFLRTYAEFLGLDGQLYVDEYGSRYVVDGDERAPRRASPRRQRERGLERKMVLLGLAGIAALAALVIVAWRFGGSSSSAPAVLPQRSASSLPSELQLTGVGSGSYVEVRRGSATGPMLLQATVPGGKVERVTGTRFWLYLRRAGGVRVSLGGKPVALPARRNLRVLVGLDYTTRAGG